MNQEADGRYRAADRGGRFSALPPYMQAVSMRPPAVRLVDQSLQRASEMTEKLLAVFCKNFGNDLFRYGLL